MNTTQILRGAKSKLEQGFTQGAFARNANGNLVVERHKDAVCWSSEGAILAVTGSFHSPETYAAIKLLRRAMQGPVKPFNDSHTKEEILEAFDKAIALAEVNS